MMGFREALATGVPLIRRLAAASWETAYRDILSEEQIRYMLATMYSEAAISEQISSPGYHYYILEAPEAVGFIGLEHHFEPNTTKLHRLYLLPEAKGKGCGRLAMDFIKEKAAASGDRRIILNVNKQNAAKKFYEKSGFKTYGSGVFDIGSGFVMDDFLMEYHF